MADTVTNVTVIETQEELVIHLTNISDGTGESAVAKTTIANLSKMPSGAAVTNLDIEQVRWAIQGMSYVKLAWDHSTPQTALVLANNGYDDFRGIDHALRNIKRTSGLVDPRTSGGTGDIKLTTVGQVSGATYDITIWFRKSSNSTAP